MLGARKIDSLAAPTLLCIGGNLARPGAMRVAAEAIAARDPAFVCVHGIDSGNALVLATRFARGYAYRGAQAILWPPAFTATEVHDRYLPLVPLRPFDRRGILQLDGTFGDEPLSIVVTQFSAERGGYIRELRFARRVLRSIGGTLILCVGGVSRRVQRIGFADLQLRQIAHHGDIVVCARGIEAEASIVTV